ncbi:MAG: divergent polysaccharide deacetylase family protein, partial [Desulfobacterota bacterium]|nr:divergent polysaccharide deacetylase family protein [Thermodesulfobacteriota bacterium]
EVMLHIPMEPKDRISHNPGKGAIYVTMEENQIAEIIQNHLHNFRYIKGVNNHMGSRATENEATMRAVFKALKPSGLYFIDSRTSSNSQAYNLAKAMKIPAGKNFIFIDNEPEVNYSKNSITKGIQLAKKNGEAIIIGHSRETTLKALKEIIPELKEQGVSLVFASALVR